MKKIIGTGFSKGIGLAIKNLLKDDYEITDFSRTSGVDLTKGFPDFDCDILINNVGIWHSSDFLENYDLNFGTACHLTEYIIDKWRKNNRSGHIIFILSNAAYKCYGNIKYSMYKGGLLLLARYLQENLKDNIKISTISPGTVNTSFWDGAAEDNRKKCIPIEPEEIAEAVKFVIDCPSIVTEMIILPRAKNVN